MKRSLKSVLWVGLAVVIPGLGIALLAKKLATKNDPYEEDFKQYVCQNFDKLKASEEKWLQ